MGKFLYVFTQQDRDKLLLRNYVLLKSDKAKEIYIFENNDELYFDEQDINAIPSDILTFKL